MGIKSYAARSPLLGYKSNSLFSDWEIMQRKTVTQAAFETVFYEYSYPIVSAIEHGMNDLTNFCIQHPFACRRRNVRATNLNAFVMQQLVSVDGLRCGEIIGNGKRSYVDLGSNRLFVKKIDHKLRPSNIPTRTVQMYQNQETINTEDDLPITYLGYQVDKGWTHITGVYAVHMEGNRIEWFTDIVNLACRDQSLYKDTTQDAEVTIKVDLKKRKAE